MPPVPDLIRAFAQPSPEHPLLLRATLECAHLMLVWLNQRGRPHQTLGVAVPCPVCSLDLQEHGRRVVKIERALPVG